MKEEKESVSSLPKLSDEEMDWLAVMLPIDKPKRITPLFMYAFPRFSKHNQDTVLRKLRYLKNNKGSPIRKRVVANMSEMECWQDYMKRVCKCLSVTSPFEYLLFLQESLKDFHDEMEIAEQKLQIQIRKEGVAIFNKFSAGTIISPEKSETKALSAPASSKYNVDESGKIPIEYAVGKRVSSESEKET